MEEIQEERMKKLIEILNRYNIKYEISKDSNNLTIGGSLDLEGTQIKELPNNLTIGGSLYLKGTQINGNNIKINILEIGYCKEKKYIYFDNILWGSVKSVKTRENLTIYKTPLGYCVVEEELSAHGDTLQEAIEDLTFKKLENIDIENIVKEIKKTRKVTKVQYRLIRGACKKGTEMFCNRHHIKKDKISLEDLRKILINDYGAKRFWKLIDGE